MHACYTVTIIAHMYNIISVVCYYFAQKLIAMFFIFFCIPSELVWREMECMTMCVNIVIIMHNNDTKFIQS